MTSHLTDFCANCGRKWPLQALDTKPQRLAGPGKWWERLWPFRLRARAIAEAYWNNEDFDRMECRECYGPGFTQGGPE